VHFTEQLHAPVPLQEAWDFIWQVQRVAACLPGCVGVDEVVPNTEYLAHFADQVGPYKVKFDLNVKIQETVLLQAVRLLASGKDARLGVTQRVDLTLQLREAGPTETILDVNAELEVLGKVATLGQFVIKRKAAEIVRQFSQNIERELTSPVQGGNRV
jgi:carbon monoxide dehydrogenase subunit G